MTAGGKTQISADKTQTLSSSWDSWWDLNNQTFRVIQTRIPKIEDRKSKHANLSCILRTLIVTTLPSPKLVDVAWLVRCDINIPLTHEVVKERPFGLSGHIDMVAPHGTGFEPLAEFSVAVSVARCPSGLVSPTLSRKVQRSSESLGGKRHWQGEALQIKNQVHPGPHPV